eukprot:4455209-Prymnesium_polylepis.1
MAAAAMPRESWLSGGLHRNFDEMATGVVGLASASSKEVKDTRRKKSKISDTANNNHTTDFHGVTGLRPGHKSFTGLRIAHTFVTDFDPNHMAQ